MIMKKLYLIFLCVFYVFSANCDTLSDYLKTNGLSELYEQKMMTLQSDVLYSDKIDEFKKTMEIVVTSAFNNQYKQALLKDLIRKFPYFEGVHEGFNVLYGIRYDVKGTINYLEKIENRTLSQNLQLLVLWNIYLPDKISMNLYQQTAQIVHEDILSYLNSDRWQSGWRAEEYLGHVGEDYQQCYSNISCLLEIIPYWMDWDANVNVVIPCDIAQNHDKVIYADMAAGGHGAETFLISDCALYAKYQYDDSLEQYMDMLFQESIGDSDGSSRYAFQAIAVGDYLRKMYQPNFNDTQYDWMSFPYTEWSVQSYYNFKKYNSVLNAGIGYKKAIDLLTKHYVRYFKVNNQQAYHAALDVLRIPSMQESKMIQPTDLKYMLLTGKDWEIIKSHYPVLTNYHEYLQYSVAYPENLRKIILSGKDEANFDIDSPNEFGKTPLMWAAQYGYLDSVKLLLSNGADINKQTELDAFCVDSGQRLCIHNSQRSALMYAAQEGQYDIVEYLVSQKADITLTDSQGMSAYHYAIGDAPQYNPLKMMTINGGAPTERNREKENHSVFSDKQLQKLKTLLTE